MADRKRIAIVGGGLAGLAAAEALSGRGLDVEIYEARRRLGGRATSFRDPASGELVDHCQHVSMACCTNLADFCRRTGLEGAFRRYGVLHFIGPDGQQFDLAASRWLPAPLHLAPALWRLKYLSAGERLSIARALWKLARAKIDPDETAPTAAEWLRAQEQTQAALDCFWSVVLVSALGETVERASIWHARKVFLDGFMGAREAYELEVPQIPLDELYGQRLEKRLAQQQVAVHLATAVKHVAGTHDRVATVELADGSRRPVDAAVVALPWWRVRAVLADELLASLPALEQLDLLSGAPITGVHLWFDQPITPLPHAVLVGRLSQWVFNRATPIGCVGGEPAEHYYQVVISGSRQLDPQKKKETLSVILGELAAIWPAAAEARLVRWRMVTDPGAVLSVRPGVEPLRPPQHTPIENLALAGDWTRTGWPSTMESAVRSGYLAAEAILAHLGQPADVLVPDLDRAPLARMLFGRR